MQHHRRGFTLIEVLVAMAVFAIFMIGILNLLDTSTKISQLETSLSDTQENIRFATYHIMRTARMLGGTGMPFAADVGGTDFWVAGELVSSPGGAYLVPGYGNVTLLPGSDVLTLRGFFEIPLFNAQPGDYHQSTNIMDISEENSVFDKVNPLDGIDAFHLQGRGVVFMGAMDQGQYAVGEIANETAITAGPKRVLQIKHGAGSAPWPDLNPDGGGYPPTFAVHRVGILESYTYYVRPDFTLMRLRLSANAQPQPIAVNIGGFDVILGMDTSGDGARDLWLATPGGAGGVSGDRVVSMRITIFGRTPFPVSGWTEPAATFNIPNGDFNMANVDRSAKWRRMQAEVTLRNYLY